MAVNRNADLGGTIMAGGGASLYPTCLGWLADDVNGDTLAPLENQPALFGTTGPNVNRSGDYNSAAPFQPYDLLYSGGCFAYTSSTAGDSRYILFGREAPCSPDTLSLDGFFTDLASTYRSVTEVAAGNGFQVTSVQPVSLSAPVVSFADNFEVDASGELEVGNSSGCTP